MNYFNLVKNIQDTALKHQFVQEFFEGDVYEIMNTKDRKYPTVILTTERIGDTNGYQTITASLFCIDRLTSDGVNKLEVQSICQTILQGILLKLESTYPEMTIQTESFVPFTEKFKDLCAGMYVECSLSYPSVICDDEVFTTKEIILKSNGIYDVIGYDRAIVSVETPTQSKELSISANGSYTVLPDEGYYLDELKLDVDVTPDLDFKYIIDVKLNITDNIALPEVYYPMFNNAYVFQIRGNVNSIEFKEGNLTNLTNISRTFISCTSLTSVTFPEGALTNVKAGEYAFQMCTSLTSLSFPKGALTKVTELAYAFSDCRSIRSISFSEGALTQVNLLRGTFFRCWYLNSLSFPEGSLLEVNNIIDTFGQCQMLTSLLFPNGALTQVRYMSQAFSFCSNLKSITFPEGALTQVQGCYKAFYACTSLQDLTIYNLPNINLSDLGFNTCTSLNLQSLQNILNALPVTTSGYKCTIGTTNLNKLSAADIQIATDKGWTLN